MICTASRARFASRITLRAAKVCTTSYADASPRTLKRLLPAISKTHLMLTYGRNSIVSRKHQSILFLYRNHTNAAERHCWKCGRTTEESELFFCECGVVQSVAEVDYFRLFGIEQTFDIDPTFLSVRLKDLQKLLHPDKYTLKSEKEKLLSEEQSSAVNKAYSTLSKPLSRALYLLELHGQPMEEDNSDVDKEFLMEIMEINEQLAEIDSLEKMKPFNEENNIKLEHGYVMLSEAFKNGDIKKAKEIVIKLKYLTNIEDKIKEFYQKNFE